MPELEPGARARNFSEVSLGYTAEMAVAEARRCYQCKTSLAKCIPNCPLGINIPKFVGHIASGNFRAACDSISKENLMPGTCGRVCPQEAQCQAQCKAGTHGDAVSVGHLERFAGDWRLARGKPASFDPNPEQLPGVAVIGSGPAGIAAAEAARQAGMRKVAVIESAERLGGECPNWGCMPTRSLLSSVESLLLAGRGRDLGVTVPKVGVEFGSLIRRERSVVDLLTGGGRIEKYLKKLDVELVRGRAAFVGPDCQ